jgi:signal peptidase I
MNSLPQQDFGDVHAVKCELAEEALRGSGSLRLKVTGWSMLPAVLPGDTLLVHSLNSDAVSEGDIVLFGRDRRLFAHRVVAKKSNLRQSEILTRGDAMARPDSPVNENELLGKVAFIVRNGRCIEPSRSRSFPERAVAALVRRSKTAARVVVGIHGMRRASEGQTSRVQTS